MGRRGTSSRLRSRCSARGYAHEAHDGRAGSDRGGKGGRRRHWRPEAPPDETTKTMGRRLLPARRALWHMISGKGGHDSYKEEALVPLSRRLRGDESTDRAAAACRATTGAQGPAQRRLLMLLWRWPARGAGRPSIDSSLLSRSLCASTTASRHAIESTSSPMDPESFNVVARRRHRDMLGSGLAMTHRGKPRHE